MNFNLEKLGWLNFQRLCSTILREVLGQTVVSFLDSRDGGRDGAFEGIWQPDDNQPHFQGKFFSMLTDIKRNITYQINSN